ncbi:MAG: polysaccharide deacetylase family protein [Sphingobacteriales bacterium]|nr:polysaccharide deacetylase family protein [Sphingobacteriales bacterium]
MNPFKSALKITVFTFAMLFIASLSATAQKTAIKLLFPGGKTKAFVFSSDDGPVHDRRLVTLLNTYHLKGTFHLNSNKLNSPNYLQKEEIKNLFKGHEVSVHSMNHPGLSGLPPAEIRSEIFGDKLALEKIAGQSVRGMAYPFGNFNDEVVEIAKTSGMEYARIVEETRNFSLPNDFLRWKPSTHQFGKAYYEAKNTENDQKELAAFNNLTADFLGSDTLALYTVWGHSWEMGDSNAKWNDLETCFKQIANSKAVCA